MAAEYIKEDTLLVIDSSDIRKKYDEQYGENNGGNTKDVRFF